MIRTNCNLL